MAVSTKQLVEEARLSVPEVSVAQAQERVAAGSLLLDVREPEEWQKGHVAGAVHVPRGMLEWKADPDYVNHEPRLAGQAETPIVVMCASGGRSLLAARTLREMGFRDVASMAGGINEWTQQGLPVEAATQG